ncbi:MAG: type II secretion system F family protein [Terriglobia bacterium]
MGEFVCRVADERGRVSVQVEAAVSEAEVRERLGDKGLYVYSVRSRALPQISLRRFLFRRRRLPADDFMLFNQQFVTLIRAGLPILQALELLAQRAARPRLRAVLDNIRREVRGGASLSEAFRTQGVFSEVYNSSLLAGERSGNLPAVLQQYVSYMKVSGNVRRQLLTALIYPALLILVATGVLTYVTLYVIPKFSELYSEMNISLPPLTVAVVTFALNLRASLLAGVLVAASLALAVLAAMRTEGGARALDRAQMKLPVVGDILLKFRLTQFCRTLSTLLAGGIPLLPSLEVSAGSMQSPVLRQAVTTAAQGVKEGRGLHAALEKSGAVPDLVTEMIQVGESTGALAEMLNSVAEFYEEELNARLARLLALVEPILLLFVSSVVLVILLALYLPIFSMGTMVR